MSAWPQPMRRFSVRRLSVPLAVLAFLAGTAGAATKTVQIGPGGSLTFSPATVTVAVGDTVEWQWMTGTHTTTRAQGREAWDSGIASAPHTFSHTFTQAGTFPYVCSIHGSLGMTGTVRVQSPSGPTTTVPGPLSCRTIEACRGDLAGGVPTVIAASKGRQRKTARTLERLLRNADRQLVRVTASSGAKRRRALEKSKRTLERLRAAVDRAASKGALGVPTKPIDATIASLLALLSVA